VETPETTSPVVEQKTQPEVTSEVPETAEKPDKTPDTNEVNEGEPNEVVPEKNDKGEQGRAFAEMRRKIKDLEEQVEGAKTRQSSFEQIRNIAPQPQYMQVDPNQFVDPQGNFNRSAYDIAVQRANFYNNQVSSRMAAETVEYKLDEWKARQKHPALNTNHKFERAVAAEYQTRLLETLSDPSRSQPKIEQIADEYAPYFSTDKKDIVKETTQKVKEQLSVKEQASLSATGRSQPGFSSIEELNRLRIASRKGDSRAIMERFKRIRSG
jgi:hypothetical protein